MNHYEEELQQNLEAGKNPEGNELDVKSYQTVFSALQQEPDFTLPSTFADRVAKLVAKKQASRSTFREYFWFGFGIFVMLIALVVAVVLTEFKLNMGFLNGLSNYKGLIIFAIFLIGVLQWIDKRIVKTAA